MPASTVPDICTCHSVREGAGGATYSMAALGVRCSYCDAREWEWEQAEEWAAMTDEERRNYYLWAARYRAERKIVELNIGPDESPF